MSEDLLRYDRMFDEALRGVVRKVLGIVAEHGLPGEHHFYLTFNTDHPGVEIAESLRRQYPDEMTIVLQKVFWDLEVSEEFFAVTLSFNAVRQRLVIPFEALTVFQDRSVKFTLQFQQAGEIEGGETTPQDESEAPDQAPAGASDGETGGGDEDNVVALDTFRKK